MAYKLKQSDIFDLSYVLSGDTRQKGDELFYKLCPYCNGGQNKDAHTFSINLQSGAYKCFRSGCGKQGHFVELARDFNYQLDFGLDNKQKIYRKLPQKAITVKDEAVSFLKTRGIGEAVAKAYRITVKKDNPDILVFPFYDEQNQLVFVKYRNTKYQKGKGSKEWCEKDTKPILFGMAQCKGFDRLIVTEGQLDSLTLAQCGFQNAVSVPTGANGLTFLANTWDWITKFKEIIVFGDYENGAMSLLEPLQNRLLGKVTVKAVRKEDYLDKKDANEIYLAYGKQAIEKAVQHAEIPPVKYVKDLADVKRVDLYHLPKIQTGITELDRILGGGLFFGQLVLLTGKRGEGKSTFMSQLAAESIRQDHTVFVYSGELADYHFKNWLDLQLAGEQHIESRENSLGEPVYYIERESANLINNWYRGKAFIYDNSFVEDEQESLLETIEKAICRYNIKLVCVDNLMTAMDIGVNDNLYHAQSAFVKKLKNIAMKYNVAIILVAHPRKTREGVDNDDVSGSSDITNRADIVLSYARNERNEFEPCDSTLSVTKNRLTGRIAKGKGAIKLFFAQRSKRIVSPETLKYPKVYGWEKDEFIEVFDSVEWEELG